MAVLRVPPGRLRTVGVIGPNEPEDPRWLDAAEALGREIARHGWVLVSGGYWGVMEAASRGAREEEGLTVGVLIGLSFTEGNPYLSLALPTGMAYARNALVVNFSEAIVAVGWSLGTLSELSLALRIRKPVFGLFQPRWPFPLPTSNRVEDAVRWLEGVLGGG